MATKNKVNVENVIVVDGRPKRIIVTYRAKRYTIIRFESGELVRESLQYINVRSLPIKLEKRIPLPVREVTEQIFSDAQQARLLK